MLLSNSLKLEVESLRNEREEDKAELAALRLEVEAMYMTKLNTKTRQRGRVARAFSVTPRRVECTPQVQLGVVWRSIFFSVACSCLVYFVGYAINGERMWRMRGQSLLPLSAGAMIMFIFAAPRDCHRKKEGKVWTREWQSISGFVLWLLVFQASFAVGHLTSNASSSNRRTGIIIISMLLWFDVPAIFLFTRMRRAVAQLSDAELSSYLLENLLFVGMPSFGPMLYLSMVRECEERKTRVGAGSKRRTPF